MFANTSARISSAGRSFAIPGTSRGFGKSDRLKTSFNKAGDSASVTTSRRQIRHGQVQRQIAQVCVHVRGPACRFAVKLQACCSARLAIHGRYLPGTLERGWIGKRRN